MEAKMKLGDYLVAYLKKIGVSHLFGIPGDLVINLFLKFGRLRGLKIITLWRPHSRRGFRSLSSAGDLEKRSASSEC